MLNAVDWISNMQGTPMNKVPTTKYDFDSTLQ